MTHLNVNYPKMFKLNGYLDTYQYVHLKNIHYIALKCGNNEIEWVKEIKYLGYAFTSKLGFNAIIKKTMLKVCQRVAMIISFRLKGFKSAALRKALFNSYIMPIFTWIYPFSHLLL